MNRSKTRIILFTLSIALFNCMTALHAKAWTNHQPLMQSVIDSLPKNIIDQLNVLSPAPCAKDEASSYAILSFTVHISPEAPKPLNNTPDCSTFKMSPMQILTSSVINDPDGVMDLNLPSDADPNYERMHWGGINGPHSGAYRHFYFAGWQWWRPRATLQYPFHTFGQAPDRVNTFAQAAKDAFRNKNPLWGARMLAWSLNYLQDLANPFNTAQIPYHEMVPWYQALHKDFSLAKQNLRERTFQAVNNYHLAFNQFVNAELDTKAETKIRDCLVTQSRKVILEFDPSKDTPRDIAITVAKASRDIAQDTGRATMNLFGIDLRREEFDLDKNPGLINIADAIIRPDLVQQRSELENTACASLIVATEGARLLIQWALQP